MEPIVFLNVAWMEFYNGIQGKDQELSGGGSYVDEYGYGFEIFNFREIEGKVYGYVKPGGANNLVRLGAKQKDEFVSDITAVFTAKYKDGGTFIVGWYRNATLYKHYQESIFEERKYRGQNIGYYVVANAQDATLLSIDERLALPKIPRRIKGGMGQSNIWYADAKIKEITAFRNQILKYINEYDQARAIARCSHKKNNDAELKKEIENIAVRIVTEYYSKIGYLVKSVEKDNVGWDLEITHNKITLKVEVKGTSSKDISVILTSNEYSKMNQYINQYRLGIVTNCLDTPELHIFSYSDEMNGWVDLQGNLLQIEQVISARCTIK